MNLFFCRNCFVDLVDLRLALAFPRDGLTTALRLALVPACFAVLGANGLPHHRAHAAAAAAGLAAAVGAVAAGGFSLGLFAHALADHWDALAICLAGVAVGLAILTAHWVIVGSADASCGADTTTSRLSAICARHQAAILGYAISFSLLLPCQSMRPTNLQLLRVPNPPLWAPRQHTHLPGFLPNHPFYICTATGWPPQQPRHRLPPQSIQVVNHSFTWLPAKPSIACLDPAPSLAGHLHALACCPALVGVRLAICSTYWLVGPPAGGMALCSRSVQSAATKYGIRVGCKMGP